MVLKQYIMERTTRLNIRGQRKNKGCLKSILFLLLSFFLLFLAFAALLSDGFLKVDNLGGGYYVTGEVGRYNLEYQHHYLGALRQLPVFRVKAVNTTDKWILVQSENDEFWAVDKTIKPSFVQKTVNGTQYDVLAESPHILTGPMDSIHFSIFLNDHRVHSWPKTIIYYNIDVSRDYSLVEHARETWYLAYNNQRKTRFISGRYNIIHQSPVCKLGYEYDTDLIFCKTEDNLYWIVNANHRTQKEVTPVDSLSFYSRLNKSNRITILSIPSETAFVKKLRRDR